MFNPYNPTSPLHLAFELGVKALSPRKFSDELPELGQRIIVLHINEISKCCLFEPKKYTAPYYLEAGMFFTHWIPYPKIN